MRPIFLTLDRKLADLIEAVDLEFDSTSGCTKYFRKLIFTASFLALSIKNSVKTKPTNSIVCPSERHLMGLLHCVAQVYSYIHK